MKKDREDPVFLNWEFSVLHIVIKHICILEKMFAVIEDWTIPTFLQSVSKNVSSDDTIVFGMTLRDDVAT